MTKPIQVGAIARLISGQEKAIDWAKAFLGPESAPVQEQNACLCAAARAELAALERLRDAVKEYEAEMSRPFPDVTPRVILRRRMFEALAACLPPKAESNERI